ncbi:PQQ-binding-like beta-propeller repeat protein [Phenylobacterium sp.]|uniref:outer membrane protein assembly factor BamB family protein n=1 Tax=Phenylobacterium sp. TaxID=1871053 RepID=UPI0025CD4B2B|nr:PQQ-binding-like beta-propeller repeat protein [Phenylobacterium sp.]
MSALALGLALATCVMAEARAQAKPAPTSAEGAAQAEGGNGSMGQFTGAGGDPALGENLYKSKCASCHDTPSGRIPPKAAIAQNTPTFIVSALVEGVMRPMAFGMAPHDIASVAAYLSARKDGGLGAGVLEAPACTDKPGAFTLAGPAWNGWGNGETQGRFQPKPGLSAAEVPRLKLKWALAYAGTRNGQATVAGGRLFLASSSGAVYALNPQIGCAYWRFDVPGGSRSSVTVGKLANGRYAAFLTGWTERTAYALDAETGALIWKTRVDNQNEVQMTGSPVLHAGRLYIPVSSAEEAIAIDDKYECCKFRGAVVAVDAASGKVAWETFMGPEPKPFKKNPKGVQMYGPAGAAIWGSPTIDARRGLLYVTTGDSYTDLAMDKAEAVVALDLKSGAIRWANQLTKGDNYIIGCYGPTPRANCPSPSGPDYDFGVAPVLHTLQNGKQLILVGQKSSQVYALDPDAKGKVVWAHRLSVGGPLGGVEFGPAADRANYYVGISDIYVKDPKPGLYAFRIADGELLWSAPSPSVACAWKNPYCTGAISQAVTAMPGIVFAGAMNGHFRAYDSQTGRVVWDVDTAAPMSSVSGKETKGGVMDGAGATVAGGAVYVTSGYQGRSGASGMVLMAFSVDGR